MNLDDVKGMMEDMGWHVLGPEPQDQKFGKWIKTIPRVEDSVDSTPPKKKVDPMFQEREKSDAGKLADKFTELLKKK